MTHVPPWFERKFTFDFPVEQYPNLCIRLRGTPARMDEIVRGAAHDRLVRKPDAKWSAQEHAGHLLDLESLWTKRVRDFVSNDGDTLTVADLSNRGTDAANFNTWPTDKVLADFQEARRHLLEEVSGLAPEKFAFTKLHPRLKQPMRLVDHLYFVAEHDDHHLARIWELIRS